jgi:hypothetical protein
MFSPAAIRPVIAVASPVVKGGLEAAIGLGLLIGSLSLAGVTCRAAYAGGKAVGRFCRGRTLPRIVWDAPAPAEAVATSPEADSTGTGDMLHA